MARITVILLSPLAALCFHVALNFGRAFGRCGHFDIRPLSFFFYFDFSRRTNEAPGAIRPMTVILGQAVRLETRLI
jgi:hypothetical protein